MMRFDLTCNIALRVEPGQSVEVQALPAITEQQHLLHEVIWVEGCERWTASAGPDGARRLDLVRCESEVRIAFAASLNLAPVWCHAAAIRDQPDTGITPRAGGAPGERWSAERIVAALGCATRGPAAVFAALPELFEWLRYCIAANQLPRYELPRYACAPVQNNDCTAQCMLEPLQFAIAVFRALGVPARIAAGYAPETVRVHPHDARAFYLELYRAGRWWLFEPDGQVPAFGFVRTMVGGEPSELALVRGGASAQPDRMDASVDPPPAWGLPLRASSRLLLSLDAQHLDTQDLDTQDLDAQDLDAQEKADPQSGVTTPLALAPVPVPEAFTSL